MKLQSKVIPSLLRQMNERQVLATLQTHGPLSRAEIARQTGISFPTVTRVVASLLDANLLDEQQPTRVTVGRPGKVVSLATKNVCVLGLVVGAQQCRVVTSGLDGSIADDETQTFDTPPSYADLLTAAVAAVRSVMQTRKATVLGLGISVPGLLNRHEGRSIVSPNVHQLDGQNLSHDLRDRLQLDTIAVQECHALCLAEQVYGLAKGIDDFAMLDVSEGLGLGVVQGGRILQGHRGLAGELGHVTVELDGRTCGCGSRGCLETVATDMALATMVSERLGHEITLDELLASARTGDLQIDHELQRVIEYLGVAVSAVINIFNPSKLFIYGRLLDAEPGLFDRLLERTATRALAPNLLDCQIVRARGSKRQGAIAAAIRGATAGWQSPQL
ncbi:MAG TPA: ROK family transcriptional regulator [Pirellulales bacterium]|nr:ROK family transcriptional regulator [Pirellulales bacterium]